MVEVDLHLHQIHIPRYLHMWVIVAVYTWLAKALALFADNVSVKAWVRRALFAALLGLLIVTCKVLNDLTHWHQSQATSFWPDKHHSIWMEALQLLPQLLSAHCHHDRQHHAARSSSLMGSLRNCLYLFPGRTWNCKVNAGVHITTAKDTFHYVWCVLLAFQLEEHCGNAPKGNIMPRHFLNVNSKSVGCNLCFTWSTSWSNNQASPFRYFAYTTGM